MKKTNSYLLALLLVFSFEANAAGPNGKLPPQLFSNPSPSEIPSHVTLPAQAMKGFYVRANHQLLKLSRLTIDLPNGKRVEAGRKRFISHPNGSQVWQGSIADSDNSSIILTRHGSAMAGVIRLGQELFKLQYVGNGVHILVQVSPNEPAPEHEPLAADTYTYGGTSSAPATDQASDDGTQIDIMVVYSTKTKERYLDIGGVNSLIALAIAESNEAYTNSAINTQLRLIHTQEVANSSGNFSADLGNLRLKTDGVLDEIHAVRDNYGADMVSWFVENNQYCGIAYVPTGDLSADAGWGFSVVYSQCATGYYSTAHELGHNMGSNHDRANAGSAVAYPYSYGYQDPNKTFRTVMAYNCPNEGCIRQQFFSNPYLEFNGRPTGIYYEANDSADNARSINQTRIPVSQWRTAVVGSPPAAGFTADCQLVNCTFTDTTITDDPITTWAWSFGDGSVSSTQHPIHSYLSAGTYTVSLTITDETGSTSIATGNVVIQDGNSQPPETPSAPTVALSGTVATSVMISWSSSENTDAYTLERQSKHPKNGKWVGSTLINTSTNSTSYIDSPGGGEFRYRLQATNQYGSSNWSGWSNPITVTSTSSGGGGGNGNGKGKKPR